MDTERFQYVSLFKISHAKKHIKMAENYSTPGGTFDTEHSIKNGEKLTYSIWKGYLLKYDCTKYRKI